MFILYKTTNTVNNKIYIGIHETQSLNDGYLGSGNNIKAAIKKYGKEVFIREIIAICDAEDEIKLLEAQVVDEAFVARLDTYNITVGGSKPPKHFGNKHALGSKHTDEWKRRKSIQFTKNTINVGRKHTMESRRINSLSKMGINKGRIHSDASKELNRIASRDNTWFKGKKWFNNGKEESLYVESPIGFVSGRLTAGIKRPEHSRKLKEFYARKKER